MSDTKILHLHDFDPTLKGRLIEEADAAELSLNNYTVSVLAKHFRVKFKGTGRKGPGAEPKPGALMLPVPIPLYNKIQMAKLKQPTGQVSLGAVVEPVIAAHFEALDAERNGHKSAA